MYIDKLDDIVNAYNNTYHGKIKMKPVDVKDNEYIASGKELMIKILNLKLVIMLEYQDTKTFFLKDILQIGLKKSLWLKKLKTQFHGYMLLVILMVKKFNENFIGTFNEKRIAKNKSRKI